MTKDLRLTIELVPRPCWYSNMRSNMPSAAWDRLRKQVYAEYNHQCGICLAQNVQLHCHEIWQYDDILHIQKLQGFIALCQMCHHCKHIGFAGILASEGKLDLDKVVEHFQHVNECSAKEYHEHSKEAWETWRERNKYEWTTDLGIYANLVSSNDTMKDKKKPKNQV